MYKNIVQQTFYVYPLTKDHNPIRLCNNVVIHRCLEEEKLLLQKCSGQNRC